MAKTTVHIQRNILSDKSETFDVVLTQHCGSGKDTSKDTVELNCVSESAAIKLIDDITRADSGVEQIDEVERVS